MAYKKEVVLYYPYVDIGDAGLIKTTALYWDKLQTIVPFDPYQLYSDRRKTLTLPDFYKTDASREAKKEGFLEERIVNPMDESVQQTGQNFILGLKEIPEIKDSLVNMLRSKQWRHARKDKYSTIYLEKFDPSHLLDIVPELSKIGIHFSPRTDGSNGFIVPKPFADMYISRLASVVAQKDNSIPLTDEHFWQDVALSRFIDYSTERKMNQLQLIKMSLKTISIDPLVPLKDILRFKDKNKNLLLNYRIYIRELARQVARGIDNAEKENVVEEIVQDKVLPVKEEIEAKLSESDIAFGLSAFDIAQAAIFGTIASSGTNWRTGIAGTGISLTISLYQSLREDRNIIKDHPLGYLYRAQKKFGAKK